MSADIYSSGSARLTSSGVVGTSGVPTRVFSIHVVSDSTAGVTTVYNSTTSTSGTDFLKLTGTINTGITFPLGSTGQLFPNGCYVSADAHSIVVTVAYSQ